MKHRTVTTTAEYYNDIPGRFKAQAKEVLQAWAKDFVAEDNVMSFDQYLTEIVPHFYECWRIIINRQIARSLFIAAIQKVAPDYNLESVV